VSILFIKKSTTFFLQRYLSFHF